MSNIEIEKSTFYAQGKRLGVKSALIGSVVFAFVDLAGIYVNTYIIEQIDTPDGVESILFSVFWIIFVILFGIAVAYFPARFLGGFLARWLNNDYGKQRLTKRIAFVKGGLVGAVAVMMICVPILLIQYNFIQQSGHGDFLVFIYRTVEATIIASLAGAWSGLQIETNSYQIESRRTKRAPDVWDSAAFSSIFLASSFSCSQAESTPAHTQVTLVVNNRARQRISVIYYQRHNPNKREIQCT